MDQATLPSIHRIRFEPWRTEAVRATSRSWGLSTILNLITLIRFCLEHIVGERDVKYRRREKRLEHVTSHWTLDVVATLNQRH